MEEAGKTAEADEVGGVEDASLRGERVLEVFGLLLDEAKLLGGAAVELDAFTTAEEPAEQVAHGREDNRNRAGRR